MEIIGAGIGAIFGLIGGIIAFIVFVITVVSIARSNHSTLQKLVWVAVAFFLSIVGSILWLILGRNKS